MREKWIEMRKSHNFDLKWFYEIYTKGFDSKKHKPFLPFEVFIKIFPQYLYENAQSIIDYFDGKFDVQSIEQNGELIYIN